MKSKRTVNVFTTRQRVRISRGSRTDGKSYTLTTQRAERLCAVVNNGKRGLLRVYPDGWLFIEL